jgi:hypothetical protein
VPEGVEELDEIEALEEVATATDSASVDSVGPRGAEVGGD